MLYRLLDILACPTDRGFPLAPVVDLESRTNTSFERPKACRVFCALEKKLPAFDACFDCHQREIIAGALVCPVCGQRFAIIDGIADLMRPDFFDEKAADEMKDQRQEMKTRDLMAKRYDSMPPARWTARFEIPAATNILDQAPALQAIELGSGTGRLTTVLAERSDLVVAVDFSMDSLVLNKEKHSKKPHVQYVRAEICSLPVRDNVFDTALSCQVFEHIPDEEMRGRAASEAARVLVKDGNLVISVYRQLWFSRIFGRKESYHFGGIYYNRFTPDEFKALLGPYFKIDVYRPKMGGLVQMAGCKKR